MKGRPKEADDLSGAGFPIGSKTTAQNLSPYLRRRFLVHHVAMLEAIFGAFASRERESAGLRSRRKFPLYFYVLAGFCHVQRKSHFHKPTVQNFSQSLFLVISFPSPVKAYYPSLNSALDFPFL
jgi:hypothetical protein